MIGMKNIFPGDVFAYKQEIVEGYPSDPHVVLVADDNCVVCIPSKVVGFWLESDQHVINLGVRRISRKQFEEHYPFYLRNITDEARCGTLPDETDFTLSPSDKYARLIHYPECWDTAAYPTLADAIWESLAWSGCSTCNQKGEV